MLGSKDLKSLKTQGFIDIRESISLSELQLVASRLQLGVLDVYVAPGPNETLRIHVPI